MSSAARAPGGLDLHTTAIGAETPAPGALASRAGSDARRGPGTDRRVVAICAVTAVTAGLLFWMVHRSLIDDVFITLSYARTFAFHFHWGLVPQEPANSATSPLNVILLGAATALTRRPVWAVGIVYVGSNVGLAWWLTKTALSLRLPVLSAIVVVALVLLNPFVLSAMGMETTLSLALLSGLLYYAVRGRPVAFGFVAGLAILTRLDLIVFVVPLVLSTPAIRRRLLRVALIVAAVSGPWFFWSWLHFGSAIPDTFAIKTLQHGFGQWDFANGPLLFLHKHAAASCLAFGPPLAGCVALFGWIVGRARKGRRMHSPFDSVAALGVGGVAYYVAYSFLTVPPYQWYYSPVMFSLVVFLVLFTARASARVVQMIPSRRGTPRAGRTALALGQALLVYALVGGQAVIVLTQGIPWRLPVIFANHASPEDYKRVGLQLAHRLDDQTVNSRVEIGSLAYYCECTLVDSFADRGRALPQIERRIDEAGPLMAPLLALNFRNLDRTQRPRPAQYDLVIEWGHAYETVTPDSWVVHSPVTGPARISLVPLIPTPVLQVPADLSGTTSLNTLVHHEAVRRVEYRLSGHGFFYDVPLGASTAGARSGWAFRWDSTSVPNGGYQLSSVAFDAAGRERRSKSVPVTVAN